MRRFIAFALLSIGILMSVCAGAAPGSLQFQATSVAVNENTGTATLTITRTGGSGGAVSVRVASSNGSATAPQDYTAINTTVNFAAGDTAAKTVTVPIAEDAAGEADETLTVTLSAPTGGATVGANATATLTIRDNDLPSAAVLTVGVAIKQLVFSWGSVPGATSYRLKQNPDGASGFTQVGADLAATATSARLDIAAHRHDWVNALYLLEACNARGCSISSSVSALNWMLGAIGYFKASNTGADDEFGISVALSADGSTLAVGAFGEDSIATGVGGSQVRNNVDPGAGAVYVFTRNGLQWTQQAYVKASTTGESDSFGRSLALSADGNTLAVGAPGEASSTTGVNGAQDLDNAPEAGAVYVFTRAGTQWTQQAYVKASNTNYYDVFGSSVALSGDGNTLAVGASGEASGGTGVGGGVPFAQLDNSCYDAGAVYLFTRTGTQWSQQAYVKASNTHRYDNFGRSLALSGDGNTLAVGAPGEDNIGVSQQDELAPSAGAVYVFTRTAGGTWSQQRYVKAFTPTSYSEFGFSVALSGDGNTLAVGAIGEASGATGINGNQTDTGAPDAGAVFLFARAGGLWFAHAYVKASNTHRYDNFGRSLALSADGNTLAVGAPSEASPSSGVDGTQDLDNAPAAGAVYVFTRAGTQWTQQAYVKASNTNYGDEFGFSVALSGDGNTMAVGARGEDSGGTGVGGGVPFAQWDNNTHEAGAVYLY